MLSFEILDIKKSMEPKLIRCNPVGPESYFVIYIFFLSKKEEGKKFQKAISKVLISSSNK